MKRNKRTLAFLLALLLILSLPLGAIAFAGGSGNSATEPSAEPANNCTTYSKHFGSIQEQPGLPFIKVNNNGTATASFVTDKDCVEVSFSVYTFDETPEPYEKQVFDNGVSEKYDKAGPATLVVQLPQCGHAQFDLYAGPLQKTLNAGYGHDHLTLRAHLLYKGSTCTTPSQTPDSTPSQEPTPTPTSTPDSTPSQEPTPTPTSTPDSTPSQEPTPTPTSTPDSTPSQEPTPTPTSTPDSTPSQEPTPTPTSTPDSTPSQEPTPTPTSTPDSTPSQEPTPTPTSTPDSTPSQEPTPTPTSTPDSTPSQEPTPTPTSTPDSTPSQGPSSTPGSTTWSTPVSSPSPTPGQTPTSTPESTPTPEESVIPSEPPQSPEPTDDLIIVEEEPIPAGEGPGTAVDHASDGADPETGVPLDTLPKTGETNILPYYLLGSLAILTGVFLLMRIGRRQKPN